MFRAYLETEIAGEKKIVQVFPQSKKTPLFNDRNAAVKKLESLKVAGRGLIFDAKKPYNDWASAYTVAL